MGAVRTFDCDAAVVAALGSACPNVFFYFREKIADSLPAITWHVVSDVPEMADDEELASRTVIAVDVWAATALEARGIAKAATVALREVGFTRDFAKDAHDPDARVRHVAMTFTGLF